MSFRVGQRVRIVKSARPDRVGAAATILRGDYSLRENYDGTGRKGFAWDLDVDGVGPLAEDGYAICYFSDELEPIDDDDSRRVVSWDECVWRPGKVSA